MVLADLGQRIRSRREQCGLKQNDLAAALQVTPQAVSKWERGENAPDIGVLVPLSQLLGVSVEWLLGAYSHQRDVFDATLVVTGVQRTRELAWQLPPRELAAWANGICYHVTEAILRSHGVPVKTMGPGGVVGLFAGIDHPRRALDAALAATTHVGDLKLKIGVASGSVYFGPVGHPDYARPDVVGEPFVVAFVIRAWAAEHTESGVVACSSTADLVPGDPRLGPPRQAEFEGVMRPLALCEVRPG